MLYEDVARFAADDVQELVLASFACPYCLGQPHRLLLRQEPHASLVECVCGWCDARYNVAVADAQTLRLALAPPRNLVLACSGDSIAAQASG